jgi:hypothetical protein
MPRKKPEKIEFEARQLTRIPGEVTIWAFDNVTWIRIRHLPDEIGEGMKLDREMFNRENGIGE